jgi:hypothetical protein
VVYHNTWQVERWPCVSPDWNVENLDRLGHCPSALVHMHIAIQRSTVVAVHAGWKVEQTRNSGTVPLPSLAFTFTCSIELNAEGIPPYLNPAGPSTFLLLIKQA